MSKFYQYINEKNKLDNFDLEQFKNDCYPYLSALKKTGYRFLYSGRKSSDIIFKKDVRKDRRPLNTDEKIHNMLDAEFKKNFGVKARSKSIFAHLVSIRTQFYGNTFYIFPIGNKYKLIWNENVNDLFTYMDIKINRKLSQKGKKMYHQSIKGLMRKFEDNDILRYNENTDKFDPPRLFMDKSKEHYERMIPLTKDEFYGMIEDVVSDTVGSYEQTKAISKDMDVEVMIVADSVWMISKKMVEEYEMAEWINNNIK